MRFGPGEANATTPTAALYAAAGSNPFGGPFGGDSGASEGGGAGRRLLGLLPPAAVLIHPDDPRLLDTSALVTVMQNDHPTHYQFWNESVQFWNFTCGRWKKGAPVVKDGS